MTDRVTLTHSFNFEAAHFLPRVPRDHKCRRLHGHSFAVDVEVEGNVDESLGWVIDYGEIKKHVAPVRDRLDHYLLNEIDGLENPTSENLALWIWRQLETALPQLSGITIRETCNNACHYRGPGR